MIQSLESKVDVKECILYSLALGIKKIQYLFENDKNFEIFPTFHCIINQHFEGKGFFGLLEEFFKDQDTQNMQILHLEQHLQIFEKIKPNDKIKTEKYFKEAVHRPNGVIAILEFKNFKLNNESDKNLFVLVSQITLKILITGGFSSKALEKESKQIIKLEIPRNMENTLKQISEFNHFVTIQQIHTYRLVGEKITFPSDCNPIHIDQEFCIKIGLKQPILHGICTFGLATLGLIQTTQIKEEQIQVVQGRFIGVVYPDENIIFRYFQDSENDKKIFYLGVIQQRNNQKCIVGSIVLKPEQKL